MPRIYGLMIVKNEADIVGQSLAHALGHCEKIVVLDNMSSDGTWQIVEDLARRHAGRIVAHCRIGERFHDGLRAIGYNAFHHELGPRDWWLRLDADEFLNESPWPVLAQAEREGADFVRANQMEFALTDADVAAIARGEDSRERPIEERRRHYRVAWREFRLFRNDPAIAWDPARNKQFPQNLSKARVASRAIFNRHYALRDIEQVKTRIAARKGSLSFTHVTEADWQAYVRPARTLHFWTPGSPPKFRPVTDFWLPRIRLELRQRLGLALKPA
jgi:glycosyltransferase involved in cell wall biosynthesis